MRLKDKEILFVVPTLTGGGAERVVSILSNALVNRGYKVNLLLNVRCNNEYFIDPKVKVYTISESNQVKAGIAGKLSRIKCRYLLTKQINPDITITFLSDAIQFLCNIPLKGKFVSTVRVNPCAGTASYKALKNLVISLSDACLVQNIEQKSYFHKFIQKKTYILSNPIQQCSFVEKPVINKTLKKIITLGRLTEQKNHRMLIDAFKIAKEQNDELILEIYGLGEEKENLENQIKSLNLQRSVFLKGRTDNAKQKLSESDLFVLSSNYEGMPNALLEAMAAGVPSISTDCPTGPSDIIENNVNGILIETNNKDELAKAILKMQDESFRRIVSKNGQEFVKKNYSVDMIVNRLVKILEQI